MPDDENPDYRRGPGRLQAVPDLAADAAMERALAIVNCGLCDGDGYRGPRVCDHIDHGAQTEHGRALVRAELEKIRQRKAASQ